MRRERVEPVMSTLCSAFVAARGREPDRRIAQASADPKGVQLRTLSQILRTNVPCEFGRRHGFADLSDPASYADAVPVRDYEAFRPYVDRMLAGEDGPRAGSPVARSPP